MEMARRWQGPIIRFAIAVVVIAMLAVPWTFPAATTAVVMKIAKIILPLSLPLIVLLAVEATLVLLAAIWWLWWRLPKRQVRSLDIQIHDPKARADTEDNFRKTVGQALGGAVVLIGAAVAYLQLTEQQQATREQLRAAHDLLISNQVSKGFEQLSGDKLAMRLGGIYGLEGVMNTSTEYHQPVLEALCAFVREGTVGKVSDKPTTDVQAALTVIGRRADGVGSVELSGAALSGANLFRANLSGANLFRADLVGADLRGANLVGVDLSGANLSGANLFDDNLSGAHLVAADLGSANLSGANLFGADLRRANLVGANLSGAHLFRANLFGAHLSGAHQGVNLFDVDKEITQEQLNGACGKLPRCRRA